MADGEAITWRYKTSATSGSFTDSYTTMTASSTVDCDPSSTISSSFGSCSSGAQTSTISITNNESSTAYYKVEYKIDSGSYQTAASNLTVTASSTDTSLTASVADGQTITWRITDSFSSADFTNMVSALMFVKSADEKLSVILHVIVWPSATDAVREVSVLLAVTVRFEAAV